MSSEHLASAETELKGELGAAWNILSGANANYTDLGIARRFGGAAAAYSLRDIGAMNGPVVRVRREPNDTTTAIDDEEIFSANQVQSGALEDWVNGKLETTLPCNVGTDFASGSFVVSNTNSAGFSGTYEFNPSNSRWERTGSSDKYFFLDGSTWKWQYISITITASSSGEYPWTSDFTDSVYIQSAVQYSSIDFSTAAAAYSLRKVKASYSGDAVRIRRSSDDAEVNVAFDSDSKVSSSSSISTVSGSTTATDLNGFLNNEHTIDFEATSFSRVRFTRTDDQTIGGQIADKFEVNATGSNYYLYNNTFFDTNASGTSLGTSQSKQVLTFKYYVDSTESPNVNYFHFRTGGAGNPVLFNEGAVYEIVKDSWQTLTLTLDAGDSVGLRYYVFISNTSSSSNASTMTVGEAFYLQDIPITYSEVTAFVHTWYDQAGSNNAVQETATYQPKIAENGALLTDGIDFDGSDNYLTLSSALGATTNQSIFTVLKSDNLESSSTGYVFDNRDGGSDGSLLYLGNGDFRYLVNSQVTVGELTTTTEVLVSAINNSSNGKIARNAVQSTSATGGALNVTTAPRIGATSYAAAPSSNHYDGTIKEIVVYNSDQSDNRFKIESNINNYYGLYNDEYEWDDATNTEWQNNVTTGTTTFTANGKDGFTITATGANISNFKYAITSPSTASDDYYKVSFNVDDPDGLLETAQLRLTATGAGATSQTITNGFNSLSLRTGASFEYMSINSDGGGSSKTATLSDFKISRIARDGFVETWYDQSGNGNNASRETAANQPSIIRNGNQVTLDNGTPSIAFERVTNIDSLEISTPLANEPYTFFATTVNNASNAWFRLFGESNAAPTVLLKNNNTTVYAPSDSDSSGDISATTTSDNIVSGFSGVNGGADGILRFNGTNLKTDISRTQDGDSINLIGRFPNAGSGFAYIESIVFYESDLTADFDTIEKELAQPINIL